jgi:hypothetical protein
MWENVSFVSVFTYFHLLKYARKCRFWRVPLYFNLLTAYIRKNPIPYRYTVTTPYLIPPPRLFHTHYSTGVISISHHTKGGGLRKKQFYITKVLRGGNLQKVLLNMTKYSDPNIESQPSKVTRYICIIFDLRQ